MKMKNQKPIYLAPRVKVVSFKVEGGFAPSVEQTNHTSLSAQSLFEIQGESNSHYERMSVSFGGNNSQSN